MRRFLILLFVACLTSFTASSQSVTGIWRGYFISESGDQYKLEFQVKENASGSYGVSGVSYSYLDVRFYGKATMTGNYIRSSKTVRIREIKTVEVKNMGGGGTCIMNYELKYSKSGKEEFLEGTYLGKPEVIGRPNVYEWGECGGGKVFLRRVKHSDFYEEPFLRKPPAKTAPKNNAAPKVSTTPKPNTTNPTAKQQPKPPVNKPITPPVVKNQPKVTVPEKSVTDTVVRRPQITNVPRPTVKIPDVLKTRQNELMKSLVVKSPVVTVKLYDNGEIDGDTISVYLDKKLVLSQKRLTAAPLTITLDMSEDDPDHELVMVAENLGRIPPNTSLMIVEAGEQRFDVRITSTEQKNAVVRFRYEKP